MCYREKTLGSRTTGRVDVPQLLIFHLWQVYLDAHPCGSVFPHIYILSLSLSLSLFLSLSLSLSLSESLAPFMEGVCTLKSKALLLGTLQEASPSQF